jgi:hypothetical protein
MIMNNAILYMFCLIAEYYKYFDYKTSKSIYYCRDIVIRKLIKSNEYECIL